jgi:RNA polymerase sigma-70 factor (ECF subfamily)
MLHTDARRAARRDRQGEFIPLAAQDTALWNHTLIAEAEQLLRQAQPMNVIGRYQLEAAVQSAHAVRRRSGRADWAAIVTLYDALIALTGSPVVAINRAVALAEMEGVAAGLAALDRLSGDSRLAQYQPWWAARADLFVRAGNVTQAHAAYENAIGLESDGAVRLFLRRKQRLCQPES